MTIEILKQPEIQLLFDANALSKAVVTNAPLEKGCCNLTFIGKNGIKYVFATARMYKEARNFKSYNGAIKMAERIGFKKIEVTL